MRQAAPPRLCCSRCARFTPFASENMKNYIMENEMALFSRTVISIVMFAESMLFELLYIEKKESGNITEEHSHMN